MALNFPPNPSVGQRYNLGSVAYVWSGNGWESAAQQDITNNVAALWSDKADKANPDVTGTINITPQAASDGITINGQMSWIDIIGDITPKIQGASGITYETFISPLNSWAHPANATGDLQYHIPHEYAMGTDMHLHLHWGHNGTAVSGSFVVTYAISFARRSNNSPALVFSTPITVTQTVSGVNITNSPQYCHRVDEIQISSAGGAGGLLDTAILSVDGLLLVKYTVTSIPAITGSVNAVNKPFVFTADVHMQSNIIGTKNKDPDFYA